MNEVRSKPSYSSQVPKFPWSLFGIAFQGSDDAILPLRPLYNSHYATVNFVKWSQNMNLVNRRNNSGIRKIGQRRSVLLTILGMPETELFNIPISDISGLVVL